LDHDVVEPRETVAWNGLEHRQDKLAERLREELPNEFGESLLG
jgi:hypothetical protein